MHAWSVEEFTFIGKIILNADYQIKVRVGKGPEPMSRRALHTLADQLLQAVAAGPDTLGSAPSFPAPLPVARGCQLIFTGGHISLWVAFKGPNVILGLCKSNGLTVK